MHSDKSLDIMPSDVEPVFQICFEHNDWENIQTKREVLNLLLEDMELMEVSDGGLTDKVLDLVDKGIWVDEVAYFNHIEECFNKAGYYTYNSDTWFEVYEDDDETRRAIEEVEE